MNQLLLTQSYNLHGGPRPPQHFGSDLVQALTTMRRQDSQHPLRNRPTNSQVKLLSNYARYFLEAPTITDLLRPPVQEFLAVRLSRVKNYDELKIWRATVQTTTGLDPFRIY